MSLTIQLNTMIAMVIMGAWLGAALDTYGRFLKRPKRATWFLFINDILFWMVQALLFFYVLLLVNEGQLRFYIILAILCGYAAYQSLFKNIYLKVLELLIKSSIWTYRFVYRLIIILVVQPIKWLIQLLIVLILFIGNVLWKILKLTFLIVYTPIKWIFQVLWRFVPQKVKIFFISMAGILVRKKNTIVKWWKKFRE
ncbi:spore cortex biosynthesis protein YabQ [Schinkia azotoformans MEV2011]|uniref:Spore cortex biosynthesis protein YabQ n=1 Tax=Schinkia azotoformans MEV2011 TaxID=1348973 RepID=A0A072NT59_SCHAZ|nr:spore cortex biosynthesis protein YabQ [Schinkia azotoformans]KEF36425.1 spore cortex biosynthesis protein YabQ [Schinkia azotoformans MEV2011]MEC1697626.1 spore cortex biosynthesis protein YabQ [Schinkia azotoformans]MEC1717333.1 spore cortex biosynthesis protein YabQ [Schinkia azotoformans]MEC1726749.1 spore cortex biosynthesis protein YabQ [Schinkia azotoformans]MEC1741592.1 spore cortex biosynthesis protein YabQ [Schinkia azotoformans]